MLLQIVYWERFQCVRAVGPCLFLFFRVRHGAASAIPQVPSRVSSEGNAGAASPALKDAWQRANKLREFASALISTRQSLPLSFGGQATSTARLAHRGKLRRGRLGECREEGTHSGREDAVV